MSRKLIYVAGPMTPRGKRDDTDNAAIEYLLNIRDLIDAGRDLIAKGYAPYTPGLDYGYFLSLQPGQVISEGAIKDVSMAFLEVCDCAVFLPRWEGSRGCEEEYARVCELEMPHWFGLENVPDDGGAE